VKTMLVIFDSRFMLIMIMKSIYEDIVVNGGWLLFLGGISSRFYDLGCVDDFLLFVRIFICLFLFGGA